MSIIKKTIISAVIFIIIIGLLVVFAIIPVLEEIKNNSEAISSEKEKYSVLEEKMSNLNKFKDLYREYSINLDKIDSLFINAEVPVEFIGFLEGIAESNNMILTISPASARNSGSEAWPFITFRISCSGTYSNFMKFLEKIESAPYLLEIQNMDVSHGETKEGEVFSGDVTAGISIKIHTK